MISVLLSCAVVGAGPAGLAVSAALTGSAVDHVVLERDDVASTWAHQRWDSFRLNTPGWMNSLLGPMEADAFCARDEVVDRLRRLGASLPVRPRTPVEYLQQDGSNFVLQLPGEQIRARTVVVASGLQNVPRVPAISDQLPSRLLQLHTSQFRSADALPDGSVLVVGSAQSGCQIAEDLALAGRRVYLCTSRVGRMPWTYRGREMLGWLVDSGFWAQRPADLDDPVLMRAPLPIVASGGRSLSLPLLSQLGVTLLGRMESVRGATVTFDDSVAANVAFGDQAAARLRATADAVIDRLDGGAPPPERDPGDGDVDQAVVTSLDLDAAEVSCVLWCTGFTGDLSWVRLPVVDDDGRPRHQGVASPVPGLWFAGFPWLTRRQSGIIYGFTADAGEIAEALTRRLALH